MTEQERYTIEKDLFNNIECVWDKNRAIAKTEDKETIKKLVNILNKQDKEINQLTKARNKHFQSLIDSEEINEALIKENEALKKRLSDLQKENYGNIDGIAFYQEENASLCEKISDLEYENEELKKENNDLKTSKEYWREKCLSKDSYNKFHHKAPIWFTQELKLTNKEVNKVAEAIEQNLKERGIKND